MNFDLIKKYNNDLLIYSLISFSMLVIYEFLQSFISFFTFDFYDLIASFFGTLIIFDDDTFISQGSHLNAFYC